MAMDTEVPNEPLRFVLRNKDPSASSQQDVLVQCAGPEEKQQWVTVVKQLLDTQLNFLKALHNPIAYQKELNKEDNHHSHHSSKHHKANTSVKSSASVNQKSSNKNAETTTTAATNVASPGNVSSATKSPKSSTKSKLFDGFRNPLKSNKSSNIG
uniref:PH domain-containing protein n=1 Tax=Romanomermis culicivorax TaxID=13658 RepID=A0A915JRH1_ROMCU